MLHPFIAYIYTHNEERDTNISDRDVQRSEIGSSLYRLYILPHVSDVWEQKQELGLTPGLELHRDSWLADVVYEGIRDVIHHALHHEAIPQGFDGGGAERKHT